MSRVADADGFPATSTTVLVVAEDDLTHRQADAALVPLGPEGIGPVTHVHDARGLDDHLESSPCALMLFDVGEAAGRAVERLGRIIARHPRVAVVAVSDADEAATAVSCIHQGAYDYLVKPLDAAATALTVRRALGLKRPRLAPSGRDTGGAFPELVSVDPAVLAAQDYVRTVARSGQPLLILGETGTGKDLLAQAAHALSGRRGEFVAVNVAGMDDTMVSDTLFGHRPGAFTGANGMRAGLVLRASAGTLFLDEIGDLSPVSQVKLLRLLQDGEYYPLGSDLAKHSTARVIAATSANLRALVAAGRFRTDLYYRLRAHLVELPPLRQRPGDLAPLVAHFTAVAAFELGVAAPTVPAELLRLMAGHSFPGNVRELQTLVHDAVARTAPGQPLSALPFVQVRAEAAAGEQRGDELLTFPAQLPTLADAQAALVREALRRARGNQAQAALQLGITRQALNKRLKTGQS